MSTYNGWTNYETWATVIWMTNDEPTQRGAVEIAAEWNRRSQCEGGTLSELADALREYVESFPDIEAVRESASLAADLLGAALDEVSWQEIAHDYASEEIGGKSAEVAAELACRQRAYLDSLRVT